MAKRIKKINVTSDKKGTVKNPYTIEEHEQMLAEGQWTEDGFVEELGLVEGESNGEQQIVDDYYWYLDLSLYDDEEDYTPKYGASSSSQALGHDCGFRCIGYILGINPLAVSDFYGDWLIRRKGYTQEQAEDAIERGITNEEIKHYFDDVYGRSTNKVSAMEYAREIVDPSNWEQSIRTAMNKFSDITAGTILTADLGDGVYHDVIANGINNSCVECYDPQNSCNMDVSFEDVKNITKIYNLNNH